MLEVKLTFNDGTQTSIFPWDAGLNNTEDGMKLFWISENPVTKSKSINSALIRDNVKKVEFIF